MQLHITLLAAILLAGCNNTSAGYRNSNNEESSNPYSEGSGHFAGYDWAKRTGGDCNGNSQSFNEGCEEYYRQIQN